MKYKVHARETLRQRPVTASPLGSEFRLSDHIKVIGNQKNGSNSDGTPNTVTIVEFVGSDDFATQWYERQQYEVDAGRLEEPLLYLPIYTQVSDPSLPKAVTVYKIGPGGVVFEEILEGGEVKFVTIESSNYTVNMKHFAVGCEYTKDLLVYNELWNLSIVERAAGKAFNALKNHIHLSPFIDYSYPSSNQTGANTSGDSDAENILLTLEDAVTAASTDTDNPRRGPYVLLVSTGMLFRLEHALLRVQQQGFSLQSSVVDRISDIIAYDGWTGSRGKKTTTYPGVDSGKGYLISTGFADQDHQSYEKQPLQRASGESDMSRFIWEQEIWDSYFNVFANPLASTEEVTFPT